MNDASPAEIVTDTPARIRAEVQAATPETGAAIVALLKDGVERLQRIEGLVSQVNTQNDLIAVLAEDLEAIEPTNANPETLTKQQWLDKAQNSIQQNNTTALTTSNDKYTKLKEATNFDEVHELIHLISGRGGRTPEQLKLMKFNEGAINYFAEAVAQQSGVAITERYKQETDTVKQYVELIDLHANKENGIADGTQRLYDMTFKGEQQAFFKAVGDAYVATVPNNKMAYSMKKMSGEEIGGNAREQVRNWSENGMKAFFDKVPLPSKANAVETGTSKSTIASIDKPKSIGR